MNKDEQLARLLRLKRHETPGEDFFEGFLDDFHAHQRRAIATQSAASLWWERLGTACSALRRPATAWAAAGAYAAVMLLIHAWPAPDHAARTTIVISDPSPGGTPAPAQRWQPPLPSPRSIPVSSNPELVPPPGKRRTADQDANPEVHPLPPGDEDQDPH